MFMAPARSIAVENDSVSIALAAPVKGPHEEAGWVMLNSVRLYIEKINQQGGINGKQILLDVYDDQDSPQQAIEIAQKIADSQALLVIGHFSGSTSIVAGDIYQAKGVPAITASTTVDSVTLENDWYFRTIFNDRRQARTLVAYILTVLKSRNAEIVSEDSPYGGSLHEQFVIAATELGLAISNEWVLENGENPDALTAQLLQVAEHIIESEKAKILILAVSDQIGATLIHQIRSAGREDVIFLGNTKIGTPSFIDFFAPVVSGLDDLNLYTNGLVTPSLMGIELGGDRARRFRSEYMERYNESPDVIAFSYYDGVKVAVEALKKIDEIGGDLSEDRIKIREILASFSSYNQSIKGLTRPIFFDREGDASSEVPLFVFTKGQFVPSFIQLSETVAIAGAVESLGAQTGDHPVDKDDHIIRLKDGTLFSKTSVAFTGLVLNKISEIDAKKYTSLLNFSIWFRFGGPLATEEIEFINASEPVSMGKPVLEETFPNGTYRLYQVEGRFFMDYLSPRKPFEEHEIGVSFRHKTLARDRLVFVPDQIDPAWDSVPSEIEKEYILSPETGWTIRMIEFYQGMFKPSALGSPRLLKHDIANVFSAFSTTVRIENLSITLADLLSGTQALPLLKISLVVLVTLLTAGRLKYFYRVKTFIWIFKILCLLVILISSEIYLLDMKAVRASEYYSDIINKGYSMLWWLVTALLICQAMEEFIWRPIEKKSGNVVPQFLRRSAVSLIILLAVFGIVAFVFDQKITSLLATSGVLAMILGLSLQMNLSNIFSGLAINIERPFRVGDHIQIDDQIGQVKDITWRTTRIETPFGNLVSIPNTMASESKVINYSFPEDTYWYGFTIHIDPVHIPGRVKKILTNAILSVEGVEEPWVLFGDVTEWSADYWVYFKVKDYSQRYRYKDAALEQAMIHLKSAGIEPAIRRHAISVSRASGSRGDRPAHPGSLLKEINIFQPFSEEAKNQISQELKPFEVRKGETVVRQGESGNSMFIIVEGVLGVYLQVPDDTGEKHSIEVARLGAGNFFGEMSLLTGEVRSATVTAHADSFLFEITKENIAPMLESEPEVSKMLGEVLTQRKMASESIRNLQMVSSVEKSNLIDQIRDRIQNFFNLTKSSV